MGVWAIILEFVAVATGFLLGMINALGLMYVSAVLLDFASIVVEGGAKTKPRGAEGDEDQEPEGAGIANFIMMACSSLATTFLFVHILFNSALAYDRRMQLAAAGIVMFLVLTGSLYGQLLGRVAPNVARFCKGAQLPLTVIAFAFTIYATYPSIVQFFAILGAIF